MTENARVTDDARMSILEHLTEFRQRLLKAVIAVGVGLIVGTIATPQLIGVLVRPLGDQVPMAIAPTESPIVFFKISLIVGLVVAMPVIVYQLFMFAAPGLNPNEKRYILIGAPAVALCFAAGVAFAGIVLIPAAIPFMDIFFGSFVEQRYSIDRYISFVSTVLLWTGLVFETPVVMFFFSKLGVTSHKTFAGARKGVIIGAAVVAAIITPTHDPFNMLLVMIPFLILYELGILLSRLA